MSLASPAARFRWSLLHETPHVRDRLAHALKLRPLTAQLLVHRGVHDAEAGEQVVRPTLAELPDPTRLPQWQAALKCLQQAVQSPEPILIHGDYDVDGMCGSVILKRTIELLGGRAEVFLPDRVSDGYSFGPRSLQAIESCGAKVVIAVDNGTTAHEALAELDRRGIQVLVVDHHLPGSSLPPCTALLNPWLAEDDGLFPHFCGAGVAYLLSWGWIRDHHGDQPLPESHRRYLFDSLGYVAIATLADSMRLEGPNRGLVRRGLETLPQSSFPGLRALCEVLGLREPSASDVAFRIAPHLNAAGRMGKTEIAFNLLIEDDPSSAHARAESLRDLNKERQAVQQNELSALLPQVEMQRERGDRVLFAGREDAAFGVLGVVAARFHEDTGLPTLLWAGCGDDVARGSARGPEGVHLVQLMDQVEQHLSGHGGHAQAAGFHFDVHDAEQLAESLRAAGADLPEPEPPTLRIDAEVQPHELDLATVEEFGLLEPFGQAFDRPMFMASKLEVCGEAQRLGAEGRHLAFRLGKDGHVVRALAWNSSDRWGDLRSGACVDVVFEASINSFRGRRNVEWILRDLRMHAES